MAPIPSPPRTLTRDSAALIVGALVNGVAAYAFVALGTRSFGAAAFAPVSVLWTFWAMSAAVFTFPVQHWVIRSFEVDGGEGGVRLALPQLAMFAVAVAAVLTAAAFVLRERFFGTSDPVWAALVLLVTVGGAATGYLRGVLAGRRRFVATASAMASENVVRLLVGILVVAVGASVTWFAAALVTGPVVMLLWPSVFRLGTDGRAQARSVVAFLGGLAGGVLLSQVALNAGPALLAAIGGAPAEVTALFATIALLRAPYLVAVGLAPRGTAPLTRLVATGGEERLRRLRSGVALLGLAGAAFAGVFGWVAGPALVDLVFGAGVAPGRSVVAMVAVGSALALVGLVATLLLVARGATTAVTVSWVAAFAVAAVTLWLGPGDALARVALAFVAAEVVALALMLAADRRAAQGRAVVPQVG